MRIGFAFNLLGALLIFLACTLLLPIPFSLYFHDGIHSSFLLASAVSLAAGWCLRHLFASKKELSRREGFAVVTLAWTGYGLFGSLPYLFSGSISKPLDAIFETMSGFTTTGSTIVTDIAALPQSILFWRALTHWLGGMGIIVLSLAILPMLGVGGMQMFRAEVPGPTADRLKPRIQDTAKLLWGVYVLLTALETILLIAGGMDFYTALCHAFATLATGGFSTENTSLAGFNPYIQWVVTLFMFLAGANFALHYYALRGRFTEYWRNEEFRWYLGFTLAALVLLTAMTWGGNYSSFAEALRHAAFQTSAILTTTGFGTADFEVWPVAGQYLLVLLMFIGGCAGSTGGGIKVARILLLFKHGLVQLHRLIHPRSIRLVKLGGQPVSDSVTQAILGFFALFMGIFVVASLAVAATGMDLVSAGAAVIATLSNIGPGLGSVGPTDNFAQVPDLGKGILILCMLLGRLELFTVLVFFLPSFWRR